MPIGGFHPKPTSEPAAEWELSWTLDEVEQWRFDELQRAGWPHMEAVRLAVDHGVDLHRACELLRKGADIDTALAILT